MNRRIILLLVFAVPAGALGYWLVQGRTKADPAPLDPVCRSPQELAYSPDGKWLAIGDATAGELVVVAASEARIDRRVKLSGRPAGIAWSPDGRFLYAALADRGEIAEVDAATGKIERRLRIGGRPAGIALYEAQKLLLVADEAADQVVVVDRVDGRVAARIGAVRSPWGVAVSPRQRMAVVGNRFPEGDASQPGISAAVTLVDLESCARVADIRLPANGVNLRGVAVSPDGRWAYVVHTIARATWPAVQIEYGGISANAVTVIDLAGRRRRATVLVDQAEQGSANPWGAAVSPDGDSLWVGFSGTHQLGRLDLARLHAELDKRAGMLAQFRSANRKGRIDDWLLSQRSPLADDPHRVELVVSEKPPAYRQGVGCACGMGVYLPGIIERFDVPTLGLRGVAVSPDGRHVAAAGYFSGSLAVADAHTGTLVDDISLGPQPPADAPRRGEMAFHDARLCYQKWFSCATCHPEGRADGLNWDLMNDGVGNPKNTRSLVLSHLGGPVMSRGVRSGFEEAVAAGFEHVLFRPASVEIRCDVEAYLRSLRAEALPALASSQLSDAVQQGKAIFEDPRVGCAQCHRGPLPADGELHDVGTHCENDWPEENAFLTPKLVELWRTTPYLHHGKAATLRDVLVKYNREDRHGRTSHLTEAEIQSLVEYLKSL